MRGLPGVGMIVYLMALPHTCARRKAHTNALLEPDTIQGDQTVQLPLLVLIFTRPQNGARRKWQRETWVGHSWFSSQGVPIRWRYAYVQARGAATPDSAILDRLVGDVVTLRSVAESYANLVYKTLEALRWALSRVHFDAVLKTDDDSMVHIGRAAQWLVMRGHPRLYAGRVFANSQVVRANFSRRDLLHPEWFPDDFIKWAVPFDALPVSDLHQGHYFPHYCSGGGYLLGPRAAADVVAASDERRALGQPVVQVEDAFIGLLARSRGLRPQDISELVQDPPASQLQTATLFRSQMLVHRVEEPRQAFRWITADSHEWTARAEVGSTATTSTRSSTGGVKAVGGGRTRDFHGRDIDGRRNRGSARGSVGRGTDSGSTARPTDRGRKFR